MRLIERHPTIEDLVVNDEALNRCKAWIEREVEDALSARKPQEQAWREALRRYEAIPKNPVRNIPIENAPNVEIPLGAIATDKIYADAIDLFFTANPPVTARAVPGGDVKKRSQQAKILQAFINWGIWNEWGLREAAETGILEDVQLGTMVLHIPWVEDRRKTKAHRITYAGPHIFAWPVEDFILPGGSKGNLQFARWCGTREWLTAGEVEERAVAEGWDISNVTPVGTVGWVRSRREILGNTQTTASAKAELYEVYTLFGYFDIDNDGLDEDLKIVWDRTSRSMLKLGYNPYDYRPHEAARYQMRAHLFAGMGVMDMLASFQDEISEIHSHRILNMLLANSRFWKAKTGTVPDNMKIWAGKVLELQSPDDLKPEVMADVYPSSQTAEQFSISMAERRVGASDLTGAKPSGVFGTRTPGITALSMLQQVNKRFTPAFSQMRDALAGAIKQCLYRYQERLLMGDAKVEQHIKQVLGDADGATLVELLKDSDFNRAVNVEMTAASASVNREADRQNAMLLVNILSQYYQRVLELTTIMANPNTPQPVRDVATKIAEAAGEMIDRTIRTFDQVRDPGVFIIQMEGELDALAGMDQQGLLGLQQMLAATGQGGQGQPALTPGGGA